MAIALNGKNNYDRYTLKVSVKSDFADIPGSTNIHMDRITKKQILKQLEHEKFYSAKYLKDNYFSFKKLNGHKIPMLTDYLKQDGAYDPLNFTKPSAYSTYFDFVKTAESKFSAELATLVEPIGDALLKFIHKLLLPAKRPYEFVILKTLMQRSSFKASKQELYLKLAKYIDKANIDTLDHAINFLKSQYFDKAEQKNYQDILLVQEKNSVELNRKVIEFSKSDNNLKTWVMDALEYGLRRYELEHGTQNFGTPFFKLYSRYTMRDTALLTNYEKCHSSFRVQGLITAVAHEYLLFVDLFKEEGIKESINYDDRFISPSEFHWQSPNFYKAIICNWSEPYL